MFFFFNFKCPSNCGVRCNLHLPDVVLQGSSSWQPFLKFPDHDVEFPNEIRPTEIKYVVKGKKKKTIVETKREREKEREMEREEKRNNV